MEFCRPKLALPPGYQRYEGRRSIPGAKDGSFGFDFDAVYTEITRGERFTYKFGGRLATVEFKEMSGRTEVTITFDPEAEHPVELQRKGWQAILDNFKQYTETH